MTKDTKPKRRSYVRKQDDPEPCGEFHNPGFWPYVAPCVYMGKHYNIPHVDKHGHEWR